MVLTFIEQIGSFTKDIFAFLPPGLVLLFAAAFIEGGKYAATFRKEFVGTLLMIVCTFSAGKWIGMEDWRVAWVSHSIGVITADYVGGGPQVNPGVTMSMFALGKISYTEALVRMTGQLAGGLVAFPLYAAISVAMHWIPFGGPEFDVASAKPHATAEAFLSEFFATILLCFVIYTVNWEFNFGSYHYIIKQTMTALAIRALIVHFPTAGPAMNPMLATCWYVFGVGKKFEYPAHFEHYFVYWCAPFGGAIVASVCYAVYNGDKIFGLTLPLGPLKSKKKTVDAEAMKKKN